MTNPTGHHPSPTDISEPAAGDGSLPHPVREARAEAHHIQQRYAHGAARPLFGYLVLMGAYGSIVASGALLVRRKATRGGVAPGLSATDLALGSIGAFRAARIITKDSVTAVLRAPFTVFEKPTEEGEVLESVPEGGVRHAIGELLTCPFCFGMWVSTVFAFGFALSPKLTRWVATTLTMYAAGDVISIGWDRLIQLG